MRGAAGFLQCHRHVPSFLRGERSGAQTLHIIKPELEPAALAASPSHPCLQHCWAAGLPLLLLKMEQGCQWQPPQGCLRVLSPALGSSGHTSLAGLSLPVLITSKGWPTCQEAVNIQQLPNGMYESTSGCEAASCWAAVCISISIWQVAGTSSLFPYLEERMKLKAS